MWVKHECLSRRKSKMNYRLESNIGQWFIVFPSRGKNGMTSHWQCTHSHYRLNWKDQSGKENIICPIIQKEDNGSSLFSQVTCLPCIVKHLLIQGESRPELYLNVCHVNVSQNNSMFLQYSSLHVIVPGLSITMFSCSLKIGWRKGNPAQRLTKIPLPS